MGRRARSAASSVDGLGVTRIEGLAELRHDLKAADKRLDRKLSKRLRDAAKIVADAAARRVPLGPGDGGHARDSITAGTSTKGAFVRGGKGDVPYYGWLDFGTREPNSTGERSSYSSGAGWSTRRVGPWANTGQGPKGGRFIYPALEANSDEVTTKVRQAVDEALNEVNL